MKTRGIRISDDKKRVVIVTLSDILIEIPNGKSLYWSILYLEAIGRLGVGTSMLTFENQINDSENGLIITWDDLSLLSKKFDQVIDVTIIGSKNKSFLQRYENNREMYETCDIVIEMIDSSYWKVFSKDENLIKRLLAKFKQTELLNSEMES
jgi:hypothetical protein